MNDKAKTKMIYHDFQLGRDIEIDSIESSYNRINEEITVKVIKDGKVFDVFYASTGAEVLNYIKYR